MNNVTAETLPIPDHVPPELVRSSPGYDAVASDWRNPFADTENVFTADYPPIFFVPGYPIPIVGTKALGTWMITRHEDIREVYQTPAVFSSHGIAGYQHLAGEDWEMLPLSVDAPMHRHYRLPLVSSVSPKAVNGMDGLIRARANALIDQFIDRGECEFISEFGRPYPISIFMRLMGFPVEEMYDRFLVWEKHILSGDDLTLEERGAGIKECIAWLRAFIADREQNPQDDLTSKIVQAQIDGRPINADEKIGLVFMLFVGGLDTIVGSLSLWFPWLCAHPEYRAKLIERPELIPGAVEELLRMNPLVSSPRTVTRDVVFRGITMKAGDVVLLLSATGNFDERKFTCPRTANFERSPNPHMTLAAGPHRCLGSHLARRELQVALETWLKRIPNFEIKEGFEVVAHAGLHAVRELRLVW